MQALDHVARQVLSDISAGRKPGKAYTDAMLAWYRKNTGDLSNLTSTAEIVFSIRESEKQSEILEALILSKCPPETIEEAFAVPGEVTAWYSELFFDVSVFRTDLDRLEYLEEYGNSWARDLKIKAVNLGYEFVLFTYANLIPKTASQKKLVERMFMATAYKAMSMNYNGIGTAASKQAVKHAELMIRAYDLLARTNADEVSGTHDLVMLLARDMEPTSMTLTPKPEEII